MKSEVAKLASHRKSLMGMLAHNEDFSYPVSLKSAKSGLTTAYSQAATSRLIEEDRYQSVMDKCAEVSHSSKDSYLPRPGSSSLGYSIVYWLRCRNSFWLGAALCLNKMRTDGEMVRKYSRIKDLKPEQPLIIIFCSAKAYIIIKWIKTHSNFTCVQLKMICLIKYFIAYDLLWNAKWSAFSSSYYRVT